MNHFIGKTVLVTGSCGTVGAELVRQLVDSSAGHIICVDNNETEMFFQLEQYKYSRKVSGHLTDIRDLQALTLRMSGVDIVLHAAALKHVGLCEDSPSQAIATNILGTQNVIDAALANSVERVVFTSSDKAVNPTNVMGTSKLMGERLMTAAAQANSGRRTLFGSTRFGNVLGSRGSVIPLFKRQIENGQPITLTDERMTRFVMTLSQAAELVLNSVRLVTAGEVFVTKMPVARIEDIAITIREVLCPESGLEIEKIGSKPGEKLYEELMNEEEVRRSYEYADFFVVLSAFADFSGANYQYLRGSPQPDRPYNSTCEQALSRDEVRAFLVENRILE